MPQNKKAKQTWYTIQQTDQRTSGLMDQLSDLQKHATKHSSHKKEVAMTNVLAMKKVLVMEKILAIKKFTAIKKVFAMKK